MRALVVVENPSRWPFDVEGVELVSARAYLTEDRYSALRGAAVFNICRRYGYQSVGYYVSLLAQARGHRPIPSVTTLQSLGSSSVVRLVSDDIESLIQKSLAPLLSDEFTLSIYFGKNLARRHDALARALFNEFPAPLLRARFVRERGEWSLVGIRPIPTSELPDEHRPFAVEQATRFFRRPAAPARSENTRYDLAILWRENDPSPPSDARAIRKFVKAAQAQGIRADVIEPDDAARVAEYDALFIRETTAVEHHTYRMARRAEWEGMVVIDDPESIIRCSNKVYQAELFRRHRIPTPATLVVHEGNTGDIEKCVGLPCVLKRPDGTFSRGVVKAEDRADLLRILPELFKESELVIAQAWTPSSFDWRIGVLEGRSLFACRYHMAPGHWQIVRARGGRQNRYGKVEAVPMAEVPEEVVDIAVRAATLIGPGFYGVDLKQVNGRCVVTEVNDNPNVDAGQEDAVLKDELYLEIMRVIRRRLDERGSQGRKISR
ncbi:MAG: RimK family alpha-L-glutamate ligase [Gemmatimonadetes bacterium]|nr:RimK family alpha-L-glutamate ligase [Gemmatimonadota bacterium]